LSLCKPIRLIDRLNASVPETVCHVSADWRTFGVAAVAFAGGAFAESERIWEKEEETKRLANVCLYAGWPDEFATKSP
jgi:hypothetical protein